MNYDVTPRSGSRLPGGLKFCKRPFTQWKPFQTRKPGKDEIQAWQSEYDPPAWAVITGAISGICVVDFDGETGRKTCEHLGLKPHVQTPSGGYHVYIESPSWTTSTVNGKSKAALGRRSPGLDFRRSRGYALFDGSTEKDPYGWPRPMKPDPLDTLPTDLQEVLGLLHPPEETVSQKTATANDRPNPPNPSGPARVSAERLINQALDHSGSGRNNAGFDLAAQLRDNGYSQSEAEAVLLDYQRRVPPANTKGQREAYTRDEALASLREAYRRPAREPWTAPRARPVPANSGVVAAAQPGRAADEPGTAAPAVTAARRPPRNSAGSYGDSMDGNDEEITELPRILDCSDPLASARLFLADEFNHDDHQILYHHRGQFFSWIRSRWRVVDDAELRVRLYGYLEASSVRASVGNGKFENVPFKPSTRRVADVLVHRNQPASVAGAGFRPSAGRTGALLQRAAASTRNAVTRQ